MPTFHGFVMLVILIDSLVVGLVTFEDLKRRYARVFFALDTIFLLIYTVEFCLKIYAEPKEYWKSSYNLFDFGILALSYVQVLLDNLNVDEGSLKILRLLRGYFPLLQIVIYNPIIKSSYRDNKSTKLRHSIFSA